MKQPPRATSIRRPAHERWSSLVLAAILLAAAATQARAESSDPPASEPQIHVYARHGGEELEAHVFRPEDPARDLPAVLVFHGGGWSLGSVEWGQGRARHVAERGLVGISIGYRLSDQEGSSVTPIEAMADARAAFRWVRSRHAELGIDPDRVAAYGWSAGAHLIASTVFFPGEGEPAEPRSSPDLMILASPALSISGSSWVQRILGGRAKAATISPVEHVRAGAPPTLLLQGRTDTVTPLAGNRRFQEAMLEAGNFCRLVVFDAVGHLYTPSTESDQGWPNPDPVVAAMATAAADAFLEEHGYR